MNAIRNHARLAATLTAGALICAGTLSTAITPATASSARQPLPTIVLVHGAWADGSSWSGEITRLQQLGYPVDVAPQFGRGPAADTAYLQDYLANISGPIVLVGHSYGGFVITDAATGNPNVKALVYVDAFVPDQGDSIASLTAGSGSVLEPALTNPTSVLQIVGYPGAPAGSGDTYVLPRVFETGFANDLPRNEAALLAATQTPFASSAFGELSTAPAWKTIPSWAVIGLQDKVIPPASQIAMDKRANAHITEINGSHLALISHPGEVTQVIVAAAAATR